MKKETESSRELFKDKTIADVYEALCVLAVKLDTLLAVFDKVDKLIDKQKEA